MFLQGFLKTQLPKKLEFDNLGQKNLKKKDFQIKLAENLEF